MQNPVVRTLPQRTSGRHPVRSSIASNGGGTINERPSGSVSFSNQFDPSPVDTAAGFHYAYDFNNDGICDMGNGTYAGSGTSPSAAVPASFLNDGPGSFTI
jgi:hypothetical protein